MVIGSDDATNNVRVSEPFETNDHQIVRFTISVRKDNIKITKIYAYFKANYDYIRTCVSYTVWCSESAVNNVDDMWQEIFLKLGTSILDIKVRKEIISNGQLVQLRESGRQRKRLGRSIKIMENERVVC